MFEISREDPSCGADSALLVRGALVSALQEKTSELVEESLSDVRDPDVLQEGLATSSSVCGQCPSTVGTDLKFTVFSSLLMSSNSPPPLSLVCPQFSPPPRLAPDESLLCSPVFAYLPPVLCKQNNRTPHTAWRKPRFWPSYPGSDDNPNNESLEFLPLLS